MITDWLSGWGYALPDVQSGLAWWPVLAVVVLLIMINVAANKAVPGYYLFWTLGGSVVVLALGLLDGCTWSDLVLAPRTWVPGLVWAGSRSCWC